MSEGILHNLFGQNLRRLRMKAGFSQLALAEETKLANTFINDIENGRKWLSCKTMARLCLVLRAEPHQFFFPISTPEHERSEILSTYIDDFSESVLKTAADFKNRYLSDI
jgi:transcriptional regulator with XRE-family HTH domain